MFAKNLLLLLLLIGSCITASAQEKTAGNDSIKVYKNLENYSKKSKFTKLVHKLLFKSSRTSKPSQKNKKSRYLIKKSFDQYEGKVIRNINIETLDPFGYSVSNELEKPEKGLERFGNNIHLKSKKWTIRNLLLFKKNEPLDSLIAKESERLVRKQRYVRSVIIKPVGIPNCKDSVDVLVRVLDSWTLIPTGAISSSQGNLELTERNFMGLGHTFENNFSNRFDDKANAYNARYTIPNIKNSFIYTTFTYGNDLENNTQKSARIERLFYSPLTHFAGGVYLEQRFFRDSLPDNSGVYAVQHFRTQTQKYWFGHAAKLFPGKSEDYRTTNFVSTIGFSNIKYFEKPDLAYDPSKFFNTEQTYLASIGITTAKFAEDKYLFNFGTIEDVPYGQVYSITGGIQNKNGLKRAYFGGRFAYGTYFNFGYFGTNIQLGSFFNNGKTEETTLRFEANYFTNLFEFGSWKLRQFINPIVTFGNNRNANIKDRLNLNESNGIAGFNSPLLTGTKKLLVTFQTQTYVPGNWHGFHFNPYFNFTLGMLGNKNDSAFNNQLLSKIGLGVLINNDYLVFNSFQLSIAFYPSIPNDGTNIFKTNSFKNNDLSIPDFEIGEPQIVPYK